MVDLSKQKSMCIRLNAIRCHGNRRLCHAITLTALWLIILLFNGCYGDQIERDQDDIDTGTSQVKFKKHHQRQTLNFNLTLDDSSLLRDKTIKNQENATAASESIVIAHVLMNKSDRSVKRIDQATSASAVKTTANNNRFDPKRDQHRKVHQSRNIINENALAFNINRQDAYKHSMENTSENRNGHIFNKQIDRVSNSKPKISSKLFNAPSVDRKTTYLSYNLVRDNVQKTQRFMPITSYQRPQHTQQIKQTSKNYIYKSYLRPKQRNNCNKCRIIPGAPIRHKPYPSTRIRYHGMYITNTG